MAVHERISITWLLQWNTQESVIIAAKENGIKPKVMKPHQHVIIMQSLCTQGQRFVAGVWRGAGCRIGKTSAETIYLTDQEHMDHPLNYKTVFLSKLLF